MTKHPGTASSTDTVSAIGGTVDGPDPNLIAVIANVVAETVTQLNDRSTAVEGAGKGERSDSGPPAGRLWRPADVEDFLRVSENVARRIMESPDAPMPVVRLDNGSRRYDPRSWWQWAAARGGVIDAATPHRDSSTGEQPNPEAAC